MRTLYQMCSRFGRWPQSKSSEVTELSSELSNLSSRRASPLALSCVPELGEFAKKPSDRAREEPQLIIFAQIRDSLKSGSVKQSIKSSL